MLGESAAEAALVDKLRALSTRSGRQRSVAGSQWPSRKSLEGGSIRQTTRCESVKKERGERGRIQLKATNPSQARAG